MKTIKSAGYLIGVYIGTIICVIAKAVFSIKEWIKEKGEDK